jgi:hypothetical protein
VKKNQTRLIFLRKRDGISSSGLGNNVEIRREEDGTKTTSIMSAVSHRRPDRQYRHGGTPEDFFRR